MSGQRYLTIDNVGLLIFPPDLFRKVAVAAAVQASDTFLDEVRGL